MKRRLFITTIFLFLLSSLQSIYSSSFEEDSKKYLGTYSITTMSLAFNASGYSSSYYLFQLVCNDDIVKEISSWDLSELKKSTIGSPTITISIDNEMRDSLKMVIVDQYGNVETIGKRTLLSDDWFPSIEGAKALIYMESGIEEAFHLSPDGRWLVVGGVVFEKAGRIENNDLESTEFPITSNYNGNTAPQSTLAHNNTLMKDVEGSAGGYIFYDCDADNDSGNADGLISSVCGWRYLEAAPADLIVINGVPTVDPTIPFDPNSTEFFCFGYYKSINNKKNLYVNGIVTFNESNCTGIAIGTGKNNTQMLVDAMGDEASESGSRKTRNYAARLCSILEYTVDGVTYDDWFLPSKEELNLMYENLCKLGIGDFYSDFMSFPDYWSSSEYNHPFSDAQDAWIQKFNDGYQYNHYRSNFNRIRPVRAF